ncbi:MAG TPA: YtxH domain-containing protein, partial [Gemmatimonadales bacterium]|nr:YtxH domain-containing protein [Gemmatimonadales bacterium]
YDDESSGGSALPMFLLGLGLGAALGILFAPQSGEDTRRALGKKARKLKAMAEDKLEELTDSAGKKGRALREAVADAADLGDDDEDDDEFEPRPSRAREELERRLAAARARRRNPAPAATTDEEHGA